MADWTGAISGSQTFADGDRVTGNVTVGAGATITVTAGATITFTGDYNITVSSSGKFVATGTAASRITFKSSSTNPTYAGTGSWSYIYLNAVTSTGNSFQYCTTRHANHAAGAFILSFGSGGAINTVQYNRHYDSKSGCSVWSSNSGAVGITFSNILVEGAGSIGTNGGIYIADTSTATHVIQDSEFRNLKAGIYLDASGPNLTIQRNLIKNCPIGIYTISETSTALTFDKNFIFLSHHSSVVEYGIHVNNSTTATQTVTVSNNIIGGSKYSCAVPILQNNAIGMGIVSSGNDIGGGNNATAGTGLYIADADNNSSSDNDAIFGCVTAAMDNFDTSESTTSTETPKQYQNLTSSRTNARSTLNFPITIDTVVATAQDQGAAFTWNSNRPMNSEIYLDRASGVDPDDPTTYEACWIADDDWSNISGRGTYKDKSTGMIGTAHSATVAGLIGGTTYYYVIRGVDPAGNAAESTEGNFKTTGSAGSTTITIVPARMDGIPKAKELPKSLPLRFPLPKKKKYGKTERK